jgi:hypothetical protein
MPVFWWKALWFTVVHALEYRVGRRGPAQAVVSGHAAGFVLAVESQVAVRG